MRKNLPLKGLTFVLSAAYGFVSASADTTIDDFTNPNNSVVSNFAGMNGNTVTRTLGSGFTAVSASPAHLEYSGNTSSNLTYAFSSATDFLTLGFTHLRLNFNSIGSDFNGNLVLTDSGAATRTITPTQPLFTTGTTSYDIPLSTGVDANGTFSLAAINQITFGMNTGNTSSVTFDLANVEAVPEPFSMVTMGAGVAAFVKNRRKKFSKKSA